MKNQYPTIALALALTTFAWIYFYSKDEQLDLTATLGVGVVALALSAVTTAFFRRKRLTRTVHAKGPSTAVDRRKERSGK